MKNEHDEKHERVLAAAQECFQLYGFKRTSMDDIAQRAGISRAALYLLFANKEAIFRRLVERLHQTGLERASAALRGHGTLAERLTDAFEGNYVALLALIEGSPHGSELLDMHHGVAASLAQQADKQFHALLAGALEQAAAHGEITFARIAMDAGQCSELLRHVARGLKNSQPPVAQYREQLAQMIRILDAALSPEAR